MKKLSFDSIIGKLCLIEVDGKITELRFGYIDSATDETSLLSDAKKQLQEYFAGSRKTFDLPLHPYGTEFQKSVWKALQNIPYGETASYKDIAEAVGNEKASRAVGMANNKNPLPIFIPCHRVIGSNGKMVGYAGGLSIKEKLLEIESN